MASQQDRHELHLALERELGPRPAATLMELLPPFDWSEIARRSDIVELRAEIAELRAEVADVRIGMKGQVARIVAANVPIMFATAGLVLAAAKLA